jgi:hypothetical protein
MKRLLAGGLALAAGLSAASVACSDGDVRYASLPGPETTNVPSTAPPPGSPADADAGTNDSGPIISCTTVAPEGEIVRGDVVAGQAPAPSGGEVVPGTYFLVNIDVYPGFNGSNGEDAGAPRPYITLIGKKTLVLADQKTFVFDEAEGDMSTGLAPATHGEGTFSVDDTDFIFSRGCPDTATVKVPYSASGGVFALHRQQSIEIYQRQP